MRRREDNVDRLFEDTLEAFPPELSEKGAARSREMLERLRSAVRVRRRRRRLVHGSALAAVLLAALAEAWTALHDRAGRDLAEPTATAPAGPQVVFEGERIVVEVVRDATPRFEIVRDRPGIAARILSGSPVEAAEVVRVIDDDELVELLEEADRPDGLVRFGGRVFLASSLTARP